MTRAQPAATVSLIAVAGLQHVWLFGVDASIAALALLSVALAGVVALARAA